MIKTMKCLQLVLLIFVPGFRSEYNNSTWKYRNNLSTPCTDKNHFFLAPGVLTAGGTNRACVSRFYPDGPARMILTLHTEDHKTVTATRDLPPGDGGCADISVPLLPNTKAELVVNIIYPEAQCNWERRLSLRIASGKVIMVHTEKPRYRPGETLRARVFVIKPDMTPAHVTIEEIWIESQPGAWEGTRVAEWSNIRSKMGLTQVQHEIDELAPPGQWTFRVRLEDGSQGSATFLVGNYELPPFQLTVRHAKRVLRTSERLVWTVCVRYPWGEGAAGMLVVRLRGVGGMSAGGRGGVRTALRLRRPRACHTHAVAAARLPLTGPNAPDVVVADFSFQEEGTRVWQNTTVVSQIVDKPLYLQFVTKSNTVVSPALPYKLKVKAIRWDDKPAPNHRIRVCRLSMADYTDTQTCMTDTTDANGVARVMFEAEENSSPLYKFEATLYNDSAIFAPPLTLTTRQSRTQAALGPMRADTRGIRTFVPLYLSLQNATAPVTVHFVVITRGGIIYRWGATTQCPIDNSSPYIQIATRHGNCDSLPQFDDNFTDQHFKNNKYITRSGSLSNQNINLDKKTDATSKKLDDLYKNKSYNKNYDTVGKMAENDDNSIQYESNVSDSLLNRHLLRIMLPIKVTQQMCPDSHLIAYFYHNGEFVSASKHFEMDDCFVNKAEVSFVARQVSPGAEVRVRVSTVGPALCALTAADSAIRGVPLSTQLVHSLSEFMAAHRNLTEYDAAGDCFLNTENLELPKASLELTAAWLASAGVRTVGEFPITRHCDPPGQLIDEKTVPRSDFSETWLWKILTIGANGSAVTMATVPDSITRYEANAVCLSKTGVAVSPPAVLQVFREFFIHADSPKRLSRGDNSIIKYRLFNYLYEPISVQIQTVTTSHLQGPPAVVQSVCVEARGSAARRVNILAVGAGKASLSIIAKAVADGGCGNGTASRGVSDEMVIKIRVDPEGVPVNEYKSTLLCGEGNSLSSKSSVNWTWNSVDAVQDTESLTVWAVGDIKGPLLADADSLVSLPRGCGEQNMARLATNLLALTQLQATGSAALTARQHVARGFTRQLQYVHPAGGFSAFGESDSTPSTWLTAFTLRYLRKAHQLLWPNNLIPGAIERAEQWLISQQMENGCFRNEGQVFHRELRGGLNEEGEISSIALTAYVISSLIEGNCTVPRKVVRNTLSCLRALPALKYKTPSRVYAHALLAYAFVSLKRYEEDVMKTNDVISNIPVTKKDGLKENEGLIEVMELIRMAKRDGEYMWWETSSLSSSVEATSYALLCLLRSPPVLQEYGAAALRWLAAHRTAAGGLVSTQDTLVALEALSAWSSLQQFPSDLAVTAVSGAIIRNVHLKPKIKIPFIMKMEGNEVSINVNGSGCALIQATRSYNTLAIAKAKQKHLSVQVSVHTDGAFDCDSANNCFCAAVVEACVVWSGSFPDMALLEISLPGGFGADASKLYAQLHQPNTLIRRIELSPSNTRATLYLSVTSQTAKRGHSCVNVYVVGPRVRTAPAYVRVVDYYHPADNDTQVYTIPEECPDRIASDVTQDLKNNVYNKARSLTNSEEILITHEFTFEDIPEGLPIEDPLYENLQLRKEDRQGKSKTAYNDGLKINDSKVTGNITNFTEVNPKRDMIIVDPKINKDVTTAATDKVKYEVNNAKPMEEMKIAEPLLNPGHQDTSNTSVVSPNTEIKEEHGYNGMENPSLSNFHVIDSDKDLEVPSGVEGPVASVVLPPPNFVPPVNLGSLPENIAPPPFYVSQNTVIPPKNIDHPPVNFLTPPQMLTRPSDNLNWYRHYFKSPYYSRLRRS